eukprot:3673809-Prymnesium_polylepis.1
MTTNAVAAPVACDSTSKLPMDGDQGCDSVPFCSGPAVGADATVRMYARGRCAVALRSQNARYKSVKKIQNVSKIGFNHQQTTKNTGRRYNQQMQQH